MTKKVLISDNLSPKAIEHLRDRGLHVDFKPELGKDKAALLKAIPDYDGLAIRSTTKVTKKLMEAAPRLKVVGRAGIGVDNIELPAATDHGILVMNTPIGNAITTAEHTIAMILSLARMIPSADTQTKQGKWPKNHIVGTEITGKTLGVIGYGTIGRLVADRARGLRMNIIIYDPHFSAEKAKEAAIEKVELDELLQRSHFITLHTPLTEETRDIINNGAIEKMKTGVFIINCARGGLVDEKALYEGLKSGKIGGAAIDVYQSEPAYENTLFNLPNIVCTPHLGASTIEAQEKVALQIAEQIADFLLDDVITNAINSTAISKEEARRLGPYLDLAEKLGLFAGQVTDREITKMEIIFGGALPGGGQADLSTDIVDPAQEPLNKLPSENAERINKQNMQALEQAALIGFLRPTSQSVNRVSAPSIAASKGLDYRIHPEPSKGAFDNYLSIKVSNGEWSRSIAGTVFSNKRPRIIKIKDVDMEADFGRHMLYITNRDTPGIIGSLGAEIGKQGINIAFFYLGRAAPGGDAICLLETDTECSNEILDGLKAIENIQDVKRLKFEPAAKKNYL